MSENVIERMKRIDADRKIAEALTGFFSKPILDVHSIISLRCLYL